MYKISSIALLILVASLTYACPPTLDFEFRKLASDETIKLCDQYAGQVLLVVNTASRCAERLLN